MLVDSHCHLDFPDFAQDIPGVIARAAEAGVTRLLTISTRVAKADSYRALAEANAAVWYTVGTHPHGAAEEPDVPAETIAALADAPRCVGIGEAGLDYHYEDAAPEAVQERVLRAHIEAARLSGLPLVIHSRDADAHMEAVLTDEMARRPFKAVLHCFSSGARLAEIGNLPLRILADPHMGQLYATAARLLGKQSRIIDSHAAFVAGIARIWNQRQ